MMPGLSKSGLNKNADDSAKNGETSLVGHEWD